MTHQGSPQIVAWCQKSPFLWLWFWT